MRHDDTALLGVHSCFWPGDRSLGFPPHFQARVFDTMHSRGVLTTATRSHDL